MQLNPKSCTLSNKFSQLLYTLLSEIRQQPEWTRALETVCIDIPAYILFKLLGISYQLKKKGLSKRKKM
jgi:hypothetical protein